MVQNKTTMKNSDIQERLNDIPEVYRNNYQKAMAGKSRAAAVKAKCLDCTCWNRAEVARCPVKTCSLWSYRPYITAENL